MEQLLNCRPWRPVAAQAARSNDTIGVLDGSPELVADGEEVLVCLVLLVSYRRERRK